MAYQIEISHNDRFVGEMTDFINGLIAVAEQVNAQMCESLHGIPEQNALEKMNISMSESFSVGKITFMNTLLGKVNSAQAFVMNSDEVFPTDEIPTTTRVTRIVYGDKPKVLVWQNSGKYSEWSWEKFLKDSILPTSMEEYYEILGDIREFEVLIPAEVLRQGICLIETPGIDDDPHIVFYTEQCIRVSDVAIQVVKSDQILGSSELRLTQWPWQDLGFQNALLVVNLHDDPDIDQLKMFVWDRFDLGAGSPYQGQDLSAHGVFFINFIKAYQGVQTSNLDLIQPSGLDNFYEHLN